MPVVPGLLHKANQLFSIIFYSFSRNIKTHYLENPTNAIVFQLREGEKFKSNTRDSLRGTWWWEGRVYLLRHGPGRFYPLDQHNPAPPPDTSLQALFGSCKQPYFCNSHCVGFSQKEIAKRCDTFFHVRLSLAHTKHFLFEHLTKGLFFFTEFRFFLENPP